MPADLLRARLGAITEKQSSDQLPLMVIQSVAAHLQTKPHPVRTVNLPIQFAIHRHAGYQCDHLGLTDTAIPSGPDYFGRIAKDVVFNPCTVDADRVYWSKSPQRIFTQQKHEHEERKNPE